MDWLAACCGKRRTKSDRLPDERTGLLDDDQLSRSLPPVRPTTSSNLDEVAHQERLLKLVDRATEQIVDLNAPHPLWQLAMEENSQDDTGRSANSSDLSSAASSRPASPTRLISALPEDSVDSPVRFRHVDSLRAGVSAHSLKTMRQQHATSAVSDDQQPTPSSSEEASVPKRGTLVDMSDEDRAFMSDALAKLDHAIHSGFDFGMYQLGYLPTYEGMRAQHIPFGSCLCAVASDDLMCSEMPSVLVERGGSSSWHGRSALPCQIRARDVESRTACLCNINDLITSPLEGLVVLYCALREPARFTEMRMGL
ncbi:uncharacterized protein L969DRAFT_93964 [Mixia osmundae IAM 14324]|uniref:Uncharacterized protein n=1 Tax=Mixia osmundae (strain CBS 9802 / IAM 14324 / JCM 22182 / KY 12970) TaxID=764103 RepID=G7E8N7_MIXOS|nr:uncharacterized protein L969DRAFT_93964 [Mixia osmundae IAM 14324]KEI40141.1 hypothetical protein L969DRAFT_93964 [Mixia osmundae IAM 14324]GAA99505.1 hypothetical protein E5Q_06206 [Mixia osmundae IAM 14324]